MKSIFIFINDAMVRPWQYNAKLHGKTKWKTQKQQLWQWEFNNVRGKKMEFSQVKFKSKIFRTCSVEKLFLEISQNLQENACAKVSFLIKLKANVCNFIKKGTLAQVFSCEFCEISKNTFSYRTPLVTASKSWMSEQRVKVKLFKRP